MTLAPVSLPSIAMAWPDFPKRVLFGLAAFVFAIGAVAGGLAVALRF